MSCLAPRFTPGSKNGDHLRIDCRLFTCRATIAKGASRIIEDTTNFSLSLMSFRSLRANSSDSQIASAASAVAKLFAPLESGIRFRPIYSDAEVATLLLRSLTHLRLSKANLG